MDHLFFMNNFSLTKKDKDFLLKLAHQAIEYYLGNKQILIIDQKKLQNYSPVLKEKIPCLGYCTDYFGSSLPLPGTHSCYCGHSNRMGLLNL